ncbi:NAD-P-binding protein [Mycena maculata]|uniref:NAD-P-binding protein n=1 Tax=Mycena maculata TaxID=230809 RepID=A0AAD7K5L6_9AGAR|nr:NAD-P-binding protein [Mycena maculata]
MRLLIFGATGTMGVLIARRFLSVYPSCTLILFVRDAAKLPMDLADHKSIVVIEGQLDHMADLSKAMEGVDAVVASLGPTGRKGPFYPSGTPIASAYARIIATMKQHGVLRLIALTTPSVRDPDDRFDLPLVLLRQTFATVARNVAKDIVAIGNVVRADGAPLDWTLVRLALHSRDEPTSSCAVVPGYMGDGKTGPRSSRIGAAAFIIDQLERREWVRKAPLLSAP